MPSESNSLLLGLFRVLQQFFCSSPSSEQGNQTGVQVQSQSQSHPQPESVHQAPSKPHVNQVHPSPSHQQHGPPPSAPHQAQEHKPHYPYKNDNLIDQNNEHYKQLRARAQEEANAMKRCFEESHRAYEARDGARAKELSNEGHAHQREMENLNSQASDWIYQANNTDSKPGEIDLHGLFVKEAITHTERAIQEAQSRGDEEIRLIVGKGLHSPQHVAKLEPAIEGLMRRYNLAAHLDEHNSGVLVVALDGQRDDHTLGSGDITKRLERKEDDCVIM